MEFQLVINQIITLFFIILVGFILRKQQLITDELNQGLNNMLMDLALPAMIISSLMVEVEAQILANLQKTFLIALINYLLVIILVNFISKGLHLGEKQEPVFKFLLIFGNVGFLAFPILNAIYPDWGVFYGTANVFVFNILLWTYGIHIFNTRNKDKQEYNLKAIFNKGVLAIIIGFILFLTKIKLGPLGQALDILGGMTTPLSMLIIGSSLAQVKLVELITDKSLYLLSALKLLLLPLLAFFILRGFNLPEVIFNISIIQLSMPSGAVGVIFAERYGGDYRYASKGILLTTLLSLFTLPLFIYLISL